MANGAADAGGQGALDRFIVGTGRCGSTLLSRMLAENPDTLSIFEYFNGLDVSRRFSPDPISGDSFAALIGAEQPVVTAVLRRGYDVAEITYPFDAGARYRRDEALPWILVSALPRLASDPDALFEEVMDFARACPMQPAVAHHRALFAWLCDRFGKSHWIERAGSSIDYLGALSESFPEARFLHIHRDGYEAALSMRGHYAYRLPIALMYRAQDGSGPPIRDIDFSAAPGPEDAISTILDSAPPVAYYGRYWNDQVLHGFSALRGIDASAYCEVRFEDLVAKPHACLERICAFFELSGGDWLESAAALVGAVPPVRFGALSEEDQRTLAEECHAGRVLLGQ